MRTCDWDDAGPGGIAHFTLDSSLMWRNVLAEECHWKLICDRDKCRLPGEAERGMALSRLLLLCVVVWEVWDSEARPIDFVCDRDSRRDMNTVAEMEAALAQCDVLTTLPSLIQLPCIKVHKASWDIKSRQEKKGDIVASLGVVAEAVRAARTLSLPGCASSLLERLAHSVNNYLHILTHLEGSAESPVSSCPTVNTQSLKKVLWTYSRLITGKLEWLMADLTDSCPSL